MSEDAIEDSVIRLIGEGIASPEEVRGCDQDEILEVERQAQVQLPAAYRRFLARMGRSAGAFLKGSDFLYPAVTGLRSDAKAILEQTQAGWSLGPTDFVFLGHQGYVFLFFDTRMGDDAPVRRFMEDEQPEEVSPSFSDWLTACVESQIAHRKRLLDGPR
jgi:hypothetical protein